MPVTHNSLPYHQGEVDVFQVQEMIEVFDGSLALAVDHLLNHIKVLVSLATISAEPELKKALARHPLLRRRLSEPSQAEIGDGRSIDRIMLSDCIRILDSVVEIAHLTAYPETAAQATAELEELRANIPFLDYRYEDDPFPSDAERES